MENMIPVINTVLPVILMLIIGMLCRRFSVMTREGILGLKSLVLNITLPCLVLQAFATMEYSPKSILLVFMMYGISILALLLGKVLRIVFREKSPFLPYLTTGFEAGMIGYALYMLLYGSDSVSYFAGVDLGQSLFVFTCYKVLLSLGNSEEKTGPKEVIKDMLSTPIIIGIIIGVLLGATGIYNALIPSGVASIFDASVNFISAPTGAVILLTIGYDLVLKDTPWGAVIKANFARLIVMAIMRIAAGLMVRAIGMGNVLDPALNIMFILPPPYVLPVFAEDENARNYISSSLSVSTILTVVLFVVLAALGI